MAEQVSESGAPHAPALWAAIFLGIATAGVYLIEDFERGSRAWAAVLILIVPMALLTVCTKLESKLLTYTILFVEIVKLIAVMLFCAVDPAWSQGWSFLLLVIALVVMADTVFIARSISIPFQWPKLLSDFSAGLRSDSKLLAWAAFVLFLQIATLLALALGVHDKTSGGLSIVETRPAEDYLSAESFDSLRPIAKIVYKMGCPDSSGARSCLSPTDMNALFVQPEIEKQFGKDASHDGRSAAVKEVFTKRHDEASAARDAFTAAGLPPGPPVPEYGDADVDLAVWNLAVLYPLLRRVEGHCSRFGEGEAPCIVTFLGHATDEVGSRGKAGNEELAAQRAHETYQLVKSLAGERNITWFVRAVSNRDEHLDASGEGYDLNVDHKQGVEVRVEQGNRLSMLDYLYFMVYTITTTGYGDLIPVSAFAQFIATIANLYEVFFVVILVNILMAGRQRRDEEQNDKPGASSPGTLSEV